MPPRSRRQLDHTQLNLLTQDGKRKRDPRGGSRVGAGRKPKGPRSSEPHKTRPVLRAYTPVHVVLRACPEVRNLRRKQALRAFAHASRTVLTRAHEFRVIHVSIQRNHVHLIIEADNRMRLARGMQALQIAAARRLNRLMRRRGQVFTDRYFAEQILAPRQARNALAYVLNNWRRHGEHLNREGADRRFDPYATGRAFSGWTTGTATTPSQARHGSRASPTESVGNAHCSASTAHRTAAETHIEVRPARSWLLSIGWLRHGKIAPWEVPSRPARPKPAPRPVKL